MQVLNIAITSGRLVILVFQMPGPGSTTTTTLEGRVRHQYQAAPASPAYISPVRPSTTRPSQLTVCGGRAYTGAVGLVPYSSTLNPPSMYYRAGDLLPYCGPPSTYGGDLRHPTVNIVYEAGQRGSHQSRSNMLTR